MKTHRIPRTNLRLNVIGLVDEAAGGKATVVCAAGNIPGELIRLWRPEDPKAYHLEPSRNGMLS